MSTRISPGSRTPAYKDRKSTEDQSMLSQLDYLILALAFLAGVIIVDGVVIKVVWNWFIPNIFAGGPRLSVAKAVGLSLVPWALWGQSQPWKPRDEEDDGKALIRLIAKYKSVALKYALILGTGFIVHHFFM